MVPLSPQLLVVAARALALVNAQDDDTFGDPLPALPDAAPPADIDSGKRWDMRFVDRCGVASHYDQRGKTSAWPMPVGLTHAELAAFAEEQRILRDEPEEGDVFLMYCDASKRYIQAGVIAGVLGEGRYNPRTPYFDLYTIVGDTDHTGRPGRGRASRVPKRLSPAQGDRFIRWADCDANRGMIRYNRSTFLRDTPEAT